MTLSSRVFQPIIDYFVDAEDREAFHESTRSALSIEGLALLCTAIYQTAHRQLTLFHAICVVHLLALLGIDVATKTRYSSFGPLQVVFATTTLSAASLAYVGWTMHVWITAPTFGSQPECNEYTIYVVFGVSLHVVEPALRWVVLSIISLMAFCLLVGTLGFVCIAGFIYYKTGVLRIHDFMKIESHEEPVAKAHTNVLHVLILFGVNIYAIVSLEQTIARNNVSPREKYWTFGQLIALFLLIGAALDLLNLCLSAMDKSKRAKKAHDNP